MTTENHIRVLGCALIILGLSHFIYIIGTNQKLSEANARVENIEKQMSMCWLMMTNAPTPITNSYATNLEVTFYNTNIWPTPTNNYKYSKTRWSIGFSNGVDGPVEVVEYSEDGKQILRHLPVLHEANR